MNTHPILSKLAKEGIRFGTDRLREFLDYIDPEIRNIACLHVAGTNGKGSVCRFLEAILRSEGYDTGLYSSPHLQNINERVRVRGMDISDEDLHSLLHSLYQKAQQWSEDQDISSEVPLTYFEMMTAVAMVYFHQAKVDIAVIEVGMGGRLDATNIVSSIVSGIVSIDFDHTDVLGDNLASIAAEKAGIIRKNVPVVVGMVNDEAFRSIRLQADVKKSPLYRLEQDFQVKSATKTSFSWQGFERIRNDLMIRMNGEHQRENAAVALAMIECIQDKFPVSDSAIRSGLLLGMNPGRIEWFQPNLLLDCAHNPAGAMRLARYLETLDRKGQNITLLLGASNDKDIRSIAVLLAPQVDRILATYCSHPRAMSDKEIEKIVSGITPTYAVGSIEEAQHYFNLDNEIVVVAGSIFLVGAMRELMAKEGQEKKDIVSLESSFGQ